MIKTPGALSSSSQTTFEDDHYSYDWGAKGSLKNMKEQIDGITLKDCKRNLFPIDDKSRKFNESNKYINNGETSPLNTSGSSITEEIFNTALSNLEFLSDDDSACAIT